MGKTSIEWTDKTWNPVTGCTKVSAGCKHCYAERIADRLWGERKFTDVQCHPARLQQPLHWKKPARIFVNSMSDLFHEAVPEDFLFAVFQTMGVASWHTYQILTKRAERMTEVLPRISARLKTEGRAPLGPVWKHVWLGVSVEDQETADERIPLLLQTPAAVRFLSVEPLLGPVNLSQFLLRASAQGAGTASIAVPGGGKPCPRCFSVGQFVDPDQINWVIVGGESGPNARPMHPDWARSIRNQCVAAGVPFFFKQ